MTFCFRQYIALSFAHSNKCSITRCTVWHVQNTSFLPVNVLRKWRNDVALSTCPDTNCKCSAPVASVSSIYMLSHMSSMAYHSHILLINICSKVVKLCSYREMYNISAWSTLRIGTASCPQLKYTTTYTVSVICMLSHVSSMAHYTSRDIIIWSEKFYIILSSCKQTNKVGWCPCLRLVFLVSEYLMLNTSQTSEADECNMTDP